MEIMTAIHTSSFGLHGSVSFTSGDANHVNTTFDATTPDVVSQSSVARLNIPRPLPLPKFVFPAKDSLPIPSPPSSLRANNRQPLSLIYLDAGEKHKFRDDVHQIIQISPSTSDCEPEPVSPCTVVPQHGSHSRGMSGVFARDQIHSANKDDSNSRSPSFPSVQIGRTRGHAHRRSAAISSGDLTSLLKPNFSLRVGSSLPCSPKPDLQINHFPQSPSSETEVSLFDHDGLPADSSYPSKACKSTRVEFSDDVQIIPRPLSMSSCDAESTLRSGHSVSNSLSSTISAVASPPTLMADRSVCPPVDPRPRTAEAAFERKDFKMGHAPKRSESLPHLTSSTMAPCSDLLIFPRLQTTSPESPCHDEKILKIDPCMPKSSTAIYPSTRSMSSSRRSSFGSKPMKNPKKVKSWAGSILSRKPRQRGQKKQKLIRLPPTPSRLADPAIEDVSLHANASVSTNMSPPKPEPETDYANWKPRRISPQDEPMSPVIDLDAALGPFNTPSSNSDTFRDCYYRGGNRKKTMHSAAGLGGFSGPGMHYHRRAESAPEFENPRFWLPRLGSSSTMAMEDVFEEDEDEEWEDARVSDKDFNPRAVDNDYESDSDTRLSHQVSPLENKRANFQGIIERKTSAVTIEKNQRLDFAVSNTTTYQWEASNQTCSPTFEKFNGPTVRLDAASQSSESISQNSPMEIAPIEIPSLSLHLSYPTPTRSRSATQSSFPSPLSPFPFDSQFMSTTHSSTSDDRAFESLLLGEPGPELRMSVDDLPSLTSSDSTMTRESSFNPSCSKPRLRDGQRSASFSATIANRKRSSIASLSRLISSAHGERSKLAIESRAPSYCEGESHHKTTTKVKRISRLMKFWKKSDDSS